MIQVFLWPAYDADHVLLLLPEQVVSVGSSCVLPLPPCVMSRPTPLPRDLSN